MRKLIFTSIAIILCSNGLLFGQQDEIKILPKVGILFNNDSILLEKSTIKEVCNRYSIIEKPTEYFYVTKNDVDSKTNRTTSETYILKELRYKSLLFSFTDASDYKNLKLESILIYVNNLSSIHFENGLAVKMSLAEFNSNFPNPLRVDSINANHLLYHIESMSLFLDVERLPSSEIQLTEIKMKQ